jgi:hypothetical protein
MMHQERGTNRLRWGVQRNAVQLTVQHARCFGRFAAVSVGVSWYRAAQTGVSDPFIPI